MRNYRLAYQQNGGSPSLVSSDAGLLIVASLRNITGTYNFTYVYALNSTTLAIVWWLLLPSDSSPPSIAMIDPPAGAGSVLVQVNDPNTLVPVFYMFDPTNGAARTGYPSSPTGGAPVVPGSITAMGGNANVLALTADDGSVYDVEVMGIFNIHPVAGCSIAATSVNATWQYCACAPLGPGVARPTAVCGFSGGMGAIFNTSVIVADASAYITLLSVDAASGYVIVHVRQPAAGADILVALFGDSGVPVWVSQLPWDSTTVSAVQLITGTRGFLWVIANSTADTLGGSGIAAVINTVAGNVKAVAPFPGWPVTAVGGTDPDTLYALSRISYNGIADSYVWLSTLSYNATLPRINATVLSRAPVEFGYEASYLAVGPAQGQLVAVSELGVASWILPPGPPAPTLSPSPRPSPPPNASTAITAQFFGSRRCEPSAGTASNYTLTSGECVSVASVTGFIGVRLNSCNASSPVASLTFWPSPNCVGGTSQAWLVREDGACYDTGFLGINLPTGCRAPPTPSPSPMLLQISSARNCNARGSGGSGAVNESLPIGECVDVETVGLGVQLASCNSSVATVHYYPQTDCSSTAYTWRVPTDGSCLDVGFAGVSVPLGSCAGPSGGNGTSLGYYAYQRPSRSPGPSRSGTPSATVHSPSVTPSASVGAANGDGGLWSRVIVWAFGR